MERAGKALLAEKVRGVCPLLTEKTRTAIVDALLDGIVEAAGKGMTLRGFGTFKFKNRKERMVTSFGRTHKVAAKKVLSFKSLVG